VNLLSIRLRGRGSGNVSASTGRAPGKRAALLLAGVVAVVAGLAVGMRGSARAENQDLLAVRQAFTASQVAEQTLDIAPVSGAAVRTANLPAAAVSDWHSRINSRLERLYTGARLAEMEQVINGHADVQVRSTSREIAGGVDSVVFRAMVIKGDSATVVARVSKWLEWANVNAQGAITTQVVRSVVNFRDTLVKTRGGWLITGEEFLSFGDNGATGP
jgi:hypothetical protein